MRGRLRRKRGEPPQIINGEGGTKLDYDYAPLLGLTMGSLRMDGAPFGASQFGFGVYTRSAGGWTISLREPDGRERARCRVAARRVRCAGSG